MPSMENMPGWLQWVRKKIDGLSATEWAVIIVWLVPFAAVWLEPVQLIITSSVEMLPWHLLLFAVLPLAIALSISVRQRPSAKRRFRVIDILISGLPIRLLWRLKTPVEDWIDTNTNTVRSSYWVSILDSPLCGKSTGWRKFCRNQLSRPPSRQNHGDLWRVYWRCTVCNAGMDDQETRDRYIDLDELRKGVIEALQRHVQNGGKIRDKMVLSFFD